MAKIRRLDDRTVIFSVPFNRFGVIPFGGRSTAIALESGSVVVFASHPPDAATQETIAKLGNGNVTHIIALDAEHHIYLSDFGKLYPSAKFVGPAGLVKRRTDLQWVISQPEQALDAELAAEFQAIALPGHPNEDIVWYHAPTKTIIQADVIFNCPDPEQVGTGYWPPKVLGSQFSVGSTVHSTLAAGFSKAKPDEFGAGIREIVALDFSRMIPCHGKVIEGPAAKDAFRTVYGKFLGGQ